MIRFPRPWRMEIWSAPHVAHTTPVAPTQRRKGCLCRGWGWPGALAMDWAAGGPFLPPHAPSEQTTRGREPRPSNRSMPACTLFAHVPGARPLHTGRLCDRNASAHHPSGVNGSGQEGHLPSIARRGARGAWRRGDDETEYTHPHSAAHPTNAGVHRAPGIPSSPLLFMYSLCPSLPQQARGTEAQDTHMAQTTSQ